MRSRVFVLLVVAALLLAACSAGQAQIAVEANEFDFGEVVIGDMATRDLVISNTGTGTLEIASITSSCGCTQATADETSIPAGGRTVLHISFDSAAHGEVFGTVLRQVFVSSNDPAQPELRIEFSATVIAKPEG